MKLVTATVGLVLGLMLSPISASALDWPSYRGGPSQNMSRGSTDPGTHPQQVWASSVTSVRREPCVIAAGGSVYAVATAATDFGAQRLHRIDAGSGDVVWSSSTYEIGQGSACPAVDAEHVYFAYGTHLAALEIADGTVAWDVDLGGFVGIPVVDEGVVYANADSGKGTLFAREASDGDPVWSATVAPSTRAPIVFPEVVLNVAPNNPPALVALDRASGAPIWSYEGPLLDVIGRGDAVIYSTGPNVVKRDAASGSTGWSYSVPPVTEASKLVADGPYVHVLAPSTNFLFQVNHLVRILAGSGAVSYSREFEKVDNCCGTTAAYPPFVKFGNTLYNHYRYFDDETGESPGGPFERTQTIFYDGKDCANEGDSNFALVDYTVYAWKDTCSTTQLVARRDLTPPAPFGVFSPLDGSFSSETPAKLLWDKVDDNSGGAGLSHLELTLDEEVVAAELDPSLTSWPLTTELGEGPHVWSITAVDVVGNERTVGPLKFKVDTTEPGPFTLLSPSDGEANAGPHPTFSWSAAEDAASGVDIYELWVDGKNAAELGALSCVEGVCSVVLEDPIADGLHSWHVRAVDGVGNARESVTSSFTVEATPPEPFGLIAPAHFAFTGARPTFEWKPAADTGSGLDRYELRIDEEVFEISAGTESFTPSEDLADGGHSWSVTAIDLAGNERQTETRSFAVDTVPPQPFALLKPQDNALSGPLPELSWKEADDAFAGLDHYEVFLDGDEIGQTSKGIESFTPGENLAHGTHTWFVSAVDKAGNRRDSNSRTFHIDTEPPTSFAQIEPVEGAVTTARPQFGWEEAVDVGKAGLDRYELIVDGEIRNLSPLVTSFTWNDDLEEGLHSWTVAAVDELGNRRETEPRSFSVDTAPPDPFSPIDPPDGAVTGPRPLLTWEAAVDQGSAGLTHYELVMDGAPIATIPAGTESFLPEEDLAPGVHGWFLTAYDAVGNRTDSGVHSFLVSSPPVAAFAESTVLALTGTPVALDASASTPPAGAENVKFVWDLDGNGSFEQDTGAEPTISTTYTEVGDLTVSVRVTSSIETSATATAQVSVRPAPPAGHLGVTINNGDKFTNKRKVTVSPVWPVFATTALISNDGGFREPDSFPLAAEIEWKLASSGSERLPKTIYVRFQEGTAGRETYQDDIVLDLTKPTLLSAALSEDGGLRVRARDMTAGVGAVQVAAQVGEPTRWRAYRPRIKLRRRGPILVRVRDRAGNVSRWLRVAPRGGER